MSSTSATSLLVAPYSLSRITCYHSRKGGVLISEQSWPPVILVGSMIVKHFLIFKRNVNPYASSKKKYREMGSTWQFPRVGLKASIGEPLKRTKKFHWRNHLDDKINPPLAETHMHQNCSKVWPFHMFISFISSLIVQWLCFFDLLLFFIKWSHSYATIMLSMINLLETKVEHLSNNLRQNPFQHVS
jgi:hypothetical protein